MSTSERQIDHARGGVGAAAASSQASRASAFEAQAGAILARLQSAVARLLGAGQTRVDRPTDLQRALAVRAPLAWQVYRWGTAGDPFATVTFIPKAEATAKVLAAAADAGFDAGVIAEVETAYAAFTAFVEHHADDRGAFDAMIAALGHGSTPQIEMKHRRAAYRANTQIWGVSTRTIYGACIYQSSDGGGVDESVVLKGLVELRALRAMASIPLTKRYMRVTQHGTVMEPSTEFMIFEDFCSDMGEGVRSVRYENEIHDTLHLRGIGSTSRTTVFVGAGVRDLPIPEDGLGVGCTIALPCEDVILDLAIPERLAPESEPRVFTTGVINDPMAAVQRTDDDAWRMPGRETGRCMGTAFEAMRCPEVPNCPELLRAAIRRMGWEESAYKLFRARIRYPVLHTHATLQAAVPFNASPNQTAARR